MVETQIYNPMDGINRMISDFESFISPMVYHFQPLMRIMGIINLPFVLIVFALILFYLVFKRKHTIKTKLADPKNYYFLGAMLLIYIFLADNPIRLGPTFNISFGLVVMPIVAKKLGPLIAGGFGIVQYAAMFILHSGEAFSITNLLIAAISGMLYGWILYVRPATYFRVLWAKFAVNMLCNVILVPMLTANVMSTELADFITNTIVSNIMLAPIQAVAIYASIMALKRLKDAMGEEQE